MSQYMAFLIIRENYKSIAWCLYFYWTMFKDRVQGVFTSKCISDEKIIYLYYLFSYDVVLLTKTVLFEKQKKTRRL